MFTAQNVSEACLLLQEKPINVVVSDINMPSMYSAIEDTRASFIINALVENERMSFIQKQVGHITTRMIVAT